MRYTKHILCSAVIFGALAAPGIAFTDDTPPTDGAELFSWLKAGKYKAWISESEKHPSAGPHPSAVIAYVNDVLNSSLTNGADSHPVGAAAVKELYDSSDQLSGWAVSVKTQPDSQHGQGWYWYEILGVESTGNVVANGNGVALCYGCHTPGQDFVLIPHPLK